MPLGPATFPCPHCQTPLRIADPAGGSRQFDCPECRRPLELLTGDDGAVLRPMSSSGATHRLDGIRVAADSRWMRLRTTFSRREIDPLTITWLAAGIVAASLIFAVARERRAGDADTHVGRTAKPPLATDANEDPTDTIEPSPAPLPEIASTDSDSIESATLPVDDRVPVAPSIGQRPPVVAEKPNAPPAADLRPEIEARLAQRVLLFEQATPVAFDTLRLQLAELASVPIVYDESLGADPTQRTAEVRVSLSDVTLADVLDAVAHAAGLDYRVDQERIRLVERTVTTKAVGELPRSDSE